jgi:hypothetical protein
MIKGIQYIVDDQGKKKSVILDLEKWGDYWESFYLPLPKNFAIFLKKSKKEQLPR